MIINCYWGKFGTKIGKWLTRKIKVKNLTAANSLLKLWMKSKYAIELISVKAYEKGLVFLVAKIVKDVTNHSVKLVKVFPQ